LGDERVVEWISVEHQETVVELILERLRHYKLMDRVKVICSVPDSDDWQRNRDVSVWPR
jgi:hypothetical protein